jgi:hypothetical protein
VLRAKSQYGEFTIEDLYDLVFPDSSVTGYLCMVYHCFLDDSKDQNQSKLMISAGFFGTREQWGSFRLGWSRVLAKHGLNYFKSSEYNSLKEEFAKFRTDAYPKPTGREAAQSIRSELQQVLRGHPGIRGVGVTVLLEEYKRTMDRPEAAGMLYTNPYHAALVSVMFETVKIIRRLPGRNMVAFVHDGGNDFPELYTIYNAFRKANPRTAKFIGGFAPLDDKLHPPLQMADMVANYTLQLGCEALANNSLKAHLKEMRANINLLGLWTEHYILSALKHELTRKGRPIPIDLQAEEYG